MRILVLDTIHGGREIGEAFAAEGHTVDVVDVYRGTTPAEEKLAARRNYDLIVAPVHLDPGHPLLGDGSTPVISHHEAVRQLLLNRTPFPMIEITGARGKTTTAHALASLLPGKGVLHTSTGTYRFPGRELITKQSITPASVLSAARYAREMDGWLIAEVSLGVTGVGDLAIVTSEEDYSFAGGKKSAIATKLASAGHAKKVLVAENIALDHPEVIHVEDAIRCEEMHCTVALGGMTFPLTNPLFVIPPYRSALSLAATAAMILHVNPTPLNTFTALPGRMSVQHEGEVIIVDNSNSGTSIATTLCAARYARYCAGTNDLTLVIGQAAGDGAVCEGFSDEQVQYAIDHIHPVRVIRVGTAAAGRGPPAGAPGQLDPADDVCETLEEGRSRAVRSAKRGSIVLAVKSWR
ncbi:MAG TPA: coenzyme F430 synthase [Methanoregula sp.]|nr:coenzyme F430 synthase [Methanoregula sp.]